MNLVAAAPIFIYSVSHLESVEKSFSVDMQFDFLQYCWAADAVTIVVSWMKQTHSQLTSLA